EGGPGPLITHFAHDAGSLPCPLYIVPGGLDNEALDRLA
ncbi:MAG: universal stress protein, partial [Pseudomonadota bacterium]|nr:universal stress protein [Pseudomonadota bacterium]